MKKKLKMECNRKKELALGGKIEMEHASLFPKKLQKKMARKIAEQHISEFECYYTKGLLPMEKGLRKLEKGLGLNKLELNKLELKKR